MDMNYRGGMWEGGGWAGWSGMGGKWDNCNSIINKYIKKRYILPHSFLSFQVNHYLLANKSSKATFLFNMKH